MTDSIAGSGRRVEKKLACRHSTQYKGKQPPKCSCISCALKWQNAQIEKLLQFVESQKVRNLRQDHDEAGMWYF